MTQDKRQPAPHEGRPPSGSSETTSKADCSSVVSPRGLGPDIQHPRRACGAVRTFSPQQGKRSLGRPEGARSGELRDPQALQQADLDELHTIESKLSPEAHAIVARSVKRVLAGVPVEVVIFSIAAAQKACSRQPVEWLRNFLPGSTFDDISAFLDGDFKAGERLDEDGWLGPDTGADFVQ